MVTEGQTEQWTERPTDGWKSLPTCTDAKEASEKDDFPTDSWTDQRTNQRTDQWTDPPPYRDAIER